MYKYMRQEHFPPLALFLPLLHSLSSSLSSIYSLLTLFLPSSSLYSLPPFPPFTLFLPFLHSLSSSLSPLTLFPPSSIYSLIPFTPFTLFHPFLHLLLPKMIPTWRVEWDSNLRPSGRRAPNLPMSHHALQLSF